MQRVLEPEVMDTAEEAVAYEAMDHSEPNAAFVARLVELGARGRVIDLGTGPGHIPVAICEAIAGTSVVGVDLSREMLRLAERRADESTHRDRLQFVIADVKALPFADGAFDVVCSNTILHHIPDPRALLREAYRVLSPMGVLLIRDLFRPPNDAGADELVALHAGDATPYQQKMFRDSLKAALTPDELRTMAMEEGLAGVTVVIDTDRHMSLQRAGR